MSPTDAILRVFAGLGFYFFGFGLVRTSVQQLTSRRVRGFLREATNHPVIAALWGFISGAVTQSSIAVSVILGGLVAQGVTSFKRAAPIVAWSNFGLVLFVFFSVIDIHLFALAGIGFAGIAMNFNFFPKYRPYFAPAFGICVALLAMWFMKEGLRVLAGTEYAQDIADTFDNSLVFAFLIGTALRTLVQSNSAVAVIGLVLNSAGVFSQHQSMMVIFGSGAGTACAAFVLTSHLKGGARQITLFEALINAIGSIVMLIFTWFSWRFGLPYLEDWIEEHVSSIQQRLAWIFFLQQLLCLGAAYLVVRVNPRIFEKWAPLPPEQDLSRVRYIDDRALEDPETAIDLALREELRIIQFLPDMIDAARQTPERPASTHFTVLHAAAEVVNRELRTYISEIISLRLPDLTARRVLRLQQRHQALVALEETIYQLTVTVRGINYPTTLLRFGNSVVEATDTVVGMFRDVFHSRDEEDMEILLKITGDRGASLERVRTDYVEKATELQAPHLSTLMTVMSLYERLVWLVHQLTTSLQATSQNPAVTVLKIKPDAE